MRHFYWFCETSQCWIVLEHCVDGARAVVARFADLIWLLYEYPLAIELERIEGE